MKHALIVDNIVKRVQPNPEDGLVEVLDNTVCGMVDNGDGTFSNPIKTQEELDVLAQELINSEALLYLDSTDWYVIRFQETGVEVPVDILTTRAEARTKVIV